LGETPGLTERVIDQMVEQTRDHAPVLADLVVRLEPAAGELIESWQSANRDASADGATLPELPTQTVQAWLDSLRQRDLRQYFSDSTAWARQLAEAGITYDRALKLFREYQRRAITLLVRVYPTGSPLETALSALDDLFDGSTVLVGAAYVESPPARAGDNTRELVLGQIFAGATHALNNLLAVVLGRMAILIERTHVAEDRAELLDIQEVAAEGAQMVRRLQDFVRGDRTDALASCDVNRLMHDAAEVTRFLWRDQAQTAGIVIDVVNDFADVPPGLARPAMLREAFVIMIVNAVDARQRGGLITLRSERRGNVILASVVQSGRAAEAKLARGEGSFFAGSAVALSEVARIAAEMNVEFTVEAEPGRATSFTLSLPLAKGASEEKEKTTMSGHPADVLLIDNEPAVRDAFTRLLALYGHHVTTAESGEKGIAAFKAGKFDVVFTDLGMPGMSGWDVAREVKRLNSKALVVLITGWPIDLNPQKSKEMGVDRVVSKPMDMPQVLGLIEDAVALRGKA
jgi:CheY-like chemotaxis protein